jgi:hypothetical protein
MRNLIYINWMKIVSNILIGLGVIFGIFAVRAIWRNYSYQKASVVVKAQLVSVELENIKPTVAKIFYTLTFVRDGYTDTIINSDMKVHYKDDPLPSMEELKSVTRYVRYVPIDNRTKTAFPDQIIINENGEYEHSYMLSYLVYMMVCGLFAYMLRPRLKSDRFLP